jgi:6-phosphogluconolactonase
MTPSPPEVVPVPVNRFASQSSDSAGDKVAGRMRARVLPSVDALAEAAAREIVDAAQRAIALRDRFLVALAGGRTPIRTYEALASPPLKDEVDWGGVEFFWSDERAVRPEDPDSNYGMARDVLLAPLGIEDRRVHRMAAEGKDLDRAARDYEAELVRVAGVPPVLDLVLLGIGADGHTASLFPGTPAPAEANRWVVASRRPDSTGGRLTLTFPTIFAARQIMVLVAGVDKAEALHLAMEGGPVMSLPSQRLQEAGSRVAWFVDADAARLTSGTNSGHAHTEAE